MSIRGAPSFTHREWCGHTAAREGETRPGFRDHHMGTACAAAPVWLPPVGFKQRGQSGDIWREKDGEGYWGFYASAPQARVR